MTEENYLYRTSQTLLRNQFPGKGKLQIPVIPKFQANPDDFTNLLLLGFDKTRLEDSRYLDRMVHFFLYDYRFERVWKDPDHDSEKLSRYRAVLSPDFSLYLEMAPVMQLYNVFRNRWCGAYWASKGIRVIPTVNWGDESTFDFCFDGIEKGSVVAVSTYMASQHDNRRDQKEWFMAGYQEMLRRIEPEKIICYHTPFPEMEGDIVFVDDVLSSWRYMSDAPSLQSKTLDAFKVGSSRKEVHHSNACFLTNKGGGSAYGGEWEPFYPEDYRLTGEPSEIKTSFTQDGTKIETKIGSNGLAESERHYTDHGQPWARSNPHDHYISWEEPRQKIPNFQTQPINYWPSSFPDGAPEFKAAKSNTVSLSSNHAENRHFQTISEFKECVLRGGEIIFSWNTTNYAVGGCKGKFSISQIYRQDTEKLCSTPDEILEYSVEIDRLRDVVTRVNVLYRTI